MSRWRSNTSPADEKLSGKQRQPREEDVPWSIERSGLRWRGRQVRVDSKQRQHHGPHGENDCEQPKVFPEPQDSVPLQVHKLTEAVGKIETGRGQTQDQRTTNSRRRFFFSGRSSMNANYRLKTLSTLLIVAPDHRQLRCARGLQEGRQSGSSKGLRSRDGAVPAGDGCRTRPTLSTS